MLNMGSLKVSDSLQNSSNKEKTLYHGLKIVYKAS
ncbi:MAG: hypothetical protein K0Q51_370 [Rickettsiaceae bacterium]|jgi:hypothetical protein|nr:hypothetical protein [Rickettsiaceae bacterium]